MYCSPQEVIPLLCFLSKESKRWVNLEIDRNRVLGLERFEPSVLIANDQDVICFSRSSAFGEKIKEKKIIFMFS